jgi:hypothetical protein
MQNPWYHARAPRPSFRSPQPAAILFVASDVDKNEEVDAHERREEKIEPGQVPLT